ncbi:arginase [Aliikangiella coralliicola]|nr:arginase [Aliikangiella coralliicola]
MKKKFKKMLLVECDLGGPEAGAALGPNALYSLLGENAELVDVIRCAEISDCHNTTPQAHNLKEINDCLYQISQSVSEFFKKNQNESLGIIAGDHSTACGSLAGLKTANPDARIGVIWIDAHADIHSPYTTPSGNVHGMPIAAAVGADHKKIAINSIDQETHAEWEKTKRLSQSSFTLNDLVYIGIRDLEQQEQEVLEQHNIPHYSVSSVSRLGGTEVATAALKYLEHCSSIYVSFDIDSLDAELVPGTGTPVTDGLDAFNTMKIISTLAASDKVKLLEVVEINPLLDQGNKTTELVARILEGVF